MEKDTDTEKQEPKKRTAAQRRGDKCAITPDQAFRDYYHQPERNMRKLANWYNQIKGKRKMPHYETLRTWSKKYKWAARIKALDAQLLIQGDRKMLPKNATQIAKEFIAKDELRAMAAMLLRTVEACVRNSATLEQQEMLKDSMHYQRLITSSLDCIRTASEMDRSADDKEVEETIATRDDHIREAEDTLMLARKRFEQYRKEANTTTTLQ